MAIATDTSERQVIPRLRDSVTAVACGEMSARPIRTDLPDISVGSDLDSKILDWQAHKELAFASDVIGTAITIGVEERAEDAARFVLESKDVPFALTALAEAALHPLRPGCQATSVPTEATANAGRRIAVCRHRLREFPRNALAWLDLSSAYLVVGELEESVRAMRVALSLQPSHRLVLRNAARLFVHLGQEDRALWILRGSESAKADPWIAAAEIAVAGAAKESPRLWAAGKKMVEGSRFGAFDLSELASAIGTTVLAKGDAKKAKKLIRQSLASPSENAVAQAEWMTKEKNLVSDIGVAELASSAEGTTLSLYVQRDWNSALDSAMRWFADQPFSSEPAIFASHMTAVLNDRWSDVIPLLEMSHRASPDNWTVVNNLAFTKAMSGDVESAEEWLRATDVGHNDPRRAGTLTATAGMIEYRRGRTEEGRLQYQAALDILTTTGHKHTKAAALVYWAQEEARLGQAMRPEIIDRARDAVRQSGLSDLEVIFARVESTVTL